MSNQEKIRLSDVLDLLSEVSQCFTREDDLPDGLLPRIDAALAAANAVNTSTIDPRWADIDFDRTNAEMRDMRAQIERLQAHIDRTQPVQAGADGYVQEEGVCKGAWELGTACGTCSKCVATKSIGLTLLRPATRCPETSAKHIVDLSRLPRFHKDSDD